MMLTVGVDIVDITRISRAIERWGTRFLDRIYTAEEQARYGARTPELAARFAAKEAVSKALGTGLVGIGWTEIEILNDARGKPYIRLSGKADARAKALGIREWSISLSHSDDHAIAFVVATG